MGNIMTELYDERIRDMNEKWRRPGAGRAIAFQIQDMWKDLRNHERLAAYRRKRLHHFGAILSHAVFTNGQPA